MNENNIPIKDKEIVHFIERLLESEEERLWKHIDECLYYAERMNKMVEILKKIKFIEDSFYDLDKIGQPLIPKYGYKDSKGNIAILLKK